MDVNAVAYPLDVAAGGRTRMTGDPVVAAEQLIEQLLFTAPGERVNRPTLGCGLIELLFDATTDELRAATEFQVKAALQQWLGTVIRVISVVVGGRASELDVTITYQLVDSPQPHTAVFQA